ncbi:hypothetical protein BLS_003136, partial [Venturia inaequalis]
MNSSCADVLLFASIGCPRPSKRLRQVMAWFDVKSGTSILDSDTDSSDGLYYSDERWALDSGKFEIRDPKWQSCLDQITARVLEGLEVKDDERKVFARLHQMRMLGP